MFLFLLILGLGEQFFVFQQVLKLLDLQGFALYFLLKMLNRGLLALYTFGMLGDCFLYILLDVLWSDANFELFLFVHIPGYLASDKTSDEKRETDSRTRRHQT